MHQTAYNYLVDCRMMIVGSLEGEYSYMMIADWKSLVEENSQTKIADSTSKVEDYSQTTIADYIMMMADS